jgi:hypothetical protein
MGAAVGLPCNEPGVLAYSFSACSDHKAAIHYKLERAGFGFHGEGPAVLNKKAQELLTPIARSLLAGMVSWKLDVGREEALLHVPEEPDQFWLGLARQAIACDADGSEQLRAILEPEKPAKKSRKQKKDKK